MEEGTYQLRKVPLTAMEKCYDFPRKFNVTCSAMYNRKKCHIFKFQFNHLYVFRDCRHGFKEPGL